MKPITGFLEVDKINRRIQKGADIVILSDPTFGFQVGSKSGTKTFVTPTHSLQDIENAFLIDSYIHRAVNEYVNKSWNEGYTLTGVNQKALDYIQTRLDIMTAVTNKSWKTPFKQALHDLVKFGNAFLVKARWKPNDAVPFVKVQRNDKLGGVAGFFCASPLMMQAALDENSNVTQWQHKNSAGSVILLDPADVIHLTYNRESGSIWGTSFLIPVLEDIRALRQMEEMVIHLVFKSLNPLIHHEVPDTTNTGRGRQEDVDAAKTSHDVMPVNGYIITPPGHKLQILGVENKALRAEGYLNAIKDRVVAGLGLNRIILGEAAGVGMGTSKSFAATMFDQIRTYQESFETFINDVILSEWLMEGGFDYLRDPRVRVSWTFNQIDVDRKVKEEEHAFLAYTYNVMTEDEVRSKLSLAPLTDEQRKGLYLNRVQLPLIGYQNSIEPTGQGGPSEPAAGGLQGKPAGQNSVDKLLDALKTLPYDEATYLLNQFNLRYKEELQEILQLPIPERMGKIEAIKPRLSMET